MKNIFNITTISFLILGFVLVANAESDNFDRQDKMRKVQNQMMELQEKLSRLTASSTKEVELKLMNHIEAKFPEQDVFVESSATSTQVVRLESKDISDTSLTQSLFASVATVPHDPFKISPQPLGPYQKGLSLGFTLKQWLDGKGKVVYVAKGDVAELRVKAEKLVPNGTYTIWCSRMTLPPNFSVVDKPCGKEDGSENVIKADADGNATLTLVAMKPLDPSTKDVKSVIALAYHSDGKTYGSNPGSFGLNSHVQLFAMLPTPAEKVARSSLFPDQSECMQSAVVKRDDSMILAVDAYYSTVIRLLKTRRDGLKAAWLVSDDRHRTEMLRTVWADFNDGRKNAAQLLNVARRAAWKQYRDDRKSCHLNVRDPFDGEGHDSRL